METNRSKLHRFALVEKKGKLALVKEDQAGERRLAVRKAIEALALTLVDGVLYAGERPLKVKAFDFSYRSARPTFTLEEGVKEVEAQTIRCLGAFVRADVGTTERVFNVFVGKTTDGIYLWAKTEPKPTEEPANPNQEMM